MVISIYENIAFYELENFLHLDGIIIERKFVRNFSHFLLNFEENILNFLQRLLSRNFQN